MKTKRQMTVTLCDNCSAMQHYCYSCHGCGKDYCFDCAKRFIKKFSHGVHFCGMDLELCSDCVAKPPEKIKKALKAYQLIQSLRAEEKAFYDDFKPRAEAAEEETKKFYDIIRDSPGKTE